MKHKLFVVDTNILISAFLFKHSNTRKAFDTATDAGKIIASIDTYQEFSEVLLRPKFDVYISPKNKMIVLNDLKELVVWINIVESIQICRDPKDNKFLELAVSANASCIITGDKDLLVLHPFRNIPILNAADFINSF